MSLQLWPIAELRSGQDFPASNTIRKIAYGRRCGWSVYLTAMANKISCFTTARQTFLALLFVAGLFIALPCLNAQDRSAVQSIQVTSEMSIPLPKFLHVYATNIDRTHGVHLSVDINIANSTGGHFVRHAAEDVPPNTKVEIDNTPWPNGYRILGSQILSASYY
jgi:hypothetical protein